MRLLITALFIAAVPAFAGTDTDEVLHCYRTAFEIMAEKPAAVLCATVKREQDTAVRLACFKRAFAITNAEAAVVLCANVNN